MQEHYSALKSGVDLPLPSTTPGGTRMLYEQFWYGFCFANISLPPSLTEQDGEFIYKNKNKTNPAGKEEGWRKRIKAGEATLSFGASSSRLLQLEPRQEPMYLHHYLAGNGSCFSSRCSGRTVAFTRAGMEQWGRELKYGIQIGNSRGCRGIQLSRRMPSVLPIYAIPMTLLSSSLQKRKGEKNTYISISLYISILQLALAQEIPAEANGRRDCSAVG